MIAIVFPGQGSQKPGMGKELAESSPSGRGVFDEVSEAVGQDVLRLCIESDEETLRRTENAQIALFTCGYAAYQALEEASPSETMAKIQVTAGHSIGEYAAAVAAGGFSLKDAARLVKTRGRLMAEGGSGTPGTMAAVLGLDRTLLEIACKEAKGVVVVANDNAPGQLVISGDLDGVRRASNIAKEKGAKRVVSLNVSGAFHSPLMQEPARLMGKALRQVPTGKLSLTLYANVTAEPVGSASELPELLEQQLASSVRWTETIKNMVSNGVDVFVECGVGDVLSGLIGRIDKSVKTATVTNSATLAATLKLIDSTA